jgi:hypothetical protein
MCSSETTEIYFYCDFVCLVGVMNQTKNGNYVKVLSLKPWKTLFMCAQTTCQIKKALLHCAPSLMLLAIFDG